jgi:hypothetical protein
MNILIYKGAFQYDVVNYFAEELAEGLKSLGHHSILYDIPKMKDSQKLTKLLVEENIELVVSFNGIALLPMTILEELNITTGIILVDHPFYHWQRINEQKGENTFVCMYDMGFLYVFEDYIDSNVPIAHLMHGGTQIQLVPSEKEYDIVVAGTMYTVEDTIPDLEKMADGVMKDIGRNMYRRALEDFSIPMDTYLKEELDSKHLDGDTFRGNTDFQQLLSYIYRLVDMQARTKMRYKILETMLEAGLTVQLFGNCQVDMLKKYSNLKYHGNVDYKQVLKEVSRSKILVNDFKPCANGSHERILSSMLNKTLVLSNKSTYCNDDYKDREGIVFYDANQLDTLITSINYYLKHDDERNRIVESAYNITAERHTWRNRSCELIGVYDAFKQMKNNN